MIGRFSPFRFDTERFELSPTMRISPKLLDASKYLICPACNKSKQPFVKTIFLPLDLSSLLSSEISSNVLICLSLVDLLRLDSYSTISLIVTVELPILLTTTPAARLENLTASSISTSQARA